MVTIKMSRTLQINMKQAKVKTNEEENAECIFCQETFLNSASGERWVRCMSCSKWAHEECAGVDPVINYDFIRLCDSSYL